MSDGSFLGKVKWFDGTKAYGFIVPDNGGNDIFFHASSILGFTPKDGDKVKYELTKNHNGRVAAANVQLSK